MWESNQSDCVLQGLKLLQPTYEGSTIASSGFLEGPPLQIFDTVCKAAAKLHIPSPTVRLKITESTATYLLFAVPRDPRAPAGLR